MSFNVRQSFLFATVLLFATLAAVPAFAQEEEAPPEADVIVTKSGPAQANPGANVTYIVRISNGGQIDAANVTLDDPLPAGMTFVSATQDSGPAFLCSTPNPGDPGSITCTAQLLAVGEMATFTFVMTIPADAQPGTTFVNIATGSTTTVDNTNENDQGVAGTSTPPPPTADLGVTKTGPAGAGPDSDVTYTIVVRNGGPSAAEDVTVTDTLPGTMTFVSLAQSGTTLNCTTPAVGAGGTITCTAATFAAGAPTTLTLTGHIPDVEPGTLFDNTAAVTAATFDPNEENNQGITSLTVSEVDLSVVKSGPATGVAGQPLTYTITVSNAGPDTALDVQLLDVLPPNTTLVSFQRIAGITNGGCTAPGAGTTGTIVCLWDLFGPGASVTFELSIRPGDTLSVTNTATVSTPSFDTNDTNDQSSVTSTITPVADLRVTKSGPASITAGTNITYTINLANLGPSTATSVTFTDVLPASTTFVSLAQSGTAFNCTTPAAGANGTITCTRAAFAPTMSTNLTLVLAVAPNATGVVENTGTIASPITDPVANNTSTTTATVTTSADLSVVKSGPAAATAGSQVTWTINVANAGPSDAANVALNDTLPANTTIVSLTQNSGPAFACTTGATVSCTAPTFAAGATASFTLVAQIAADATGTISNTATISATTADPATGNNTSTTNMILGANADLRVTKTGPATAVSGSEISYAVELVNLGPSSAANVVMTDVVPANTTFVSVVQNSGPTFACTRAVCTHPLLPPGVATFTFTFRIDDDAFEPIANTVNVTSDTPDPAPGNGSTTAGTAVVAGATDLRITKIANATTAPAGATATFTIDVINDGPATAVDTVVMDVLPAGTTFQSATSTQGTCTGTTTVTCTIGTLAPGGTATITLMVTLPSTPTLVTNTATVAATNAESDPLDNSSSATIDVGPGVEGIPTLSPAMLAALALLIAFVALKR